MWLDPYEISIVENHRYTLKGMHGRLTRKAVHACQPMPLYILQGDGEEHERGQENKESSHLQNRQARN